MTSNGDNWKALYSDSSEDERPAPQIQSVPKASGQLEGSPRLQPLPKSTGAGWQPGVTALSHSKQSGLHICPSGADLPMPSPQRSRPTEPPHVPKATYRGNANVAPAGASKKTGRRSALGLLEPESSDSDAPPTSFGASKPLPGSIPRTTAAPVRDVGLGYNGITSFAAPTSREGVFEHEVWPRDQDGHETATAAAVAALSAPKVSPTQKRRRVSAVPSGAVEGDDHAFASGFGETTAGVEAEPSSPSRLEQHCLGSEPWRHVQDGRSRLALFPGPDGGQGMQWSEGPLHLEGGAILPETIASRLRKYQREGVAWLYRRLFVEGKGGLLADEMGLGKTVQVACCLAAGLYAGPTVNTGQSGDAKQDEPGPVLVLCPPSLVQNWARELEKWGPFKVEILPPNINTGIGGPGRARDRTLQRVDAGMVDVLVASRGLVRTDEDAPTDSGLMSRRWGCMVVDEIHQAKNPKGQLHKALVAIHSPRKLGLSGTPFQNCISDIWALLHVTGAHEPWDLSSFESRFGRPMARGQKRNASVKDLAVREDALREFREFLAAVCLRRTKDDVALMLPGKNDRIVPCPLSEVQRAAYKNLLASSDFQLALGKRQLCVCGAGRPCLCGTGPVWRHIHQRQAQQKGLEDEWAAADECGCRGRVPPRCMSFSLIVILQRITNHIENLKPDPGTPKDASEHAQQTLMRELCGIAFAGIEHNLCTNKQVSNRMLLGSPEACGKMQVLLPLLKHWRRRGQKVLIFSRSTRLLDILEACLWQQGSSPEVLRLDGGTPPSQRQHLVDEFNSSAQRSIFLISTRAGGVGLNLTAASVVVIFDPDWNPFSDLQAQDRSFRIGQTRVVEVYRLLGAGTVEEHVYVRQVWKQQLASTAIDGTRSARRLDGATTGIRGLLEFHDTSRLAELMSEVFKKGSTASASPSLCPIPSESTTSLQIFCDIRNAAAIETADPTDDNSHDALSDSSVPQPAQPEPPPKPEHVVASQALEALHGMFDQLDHSKLMRNDTQENLFLNDLDPVQDDE